jgi:hypothetical protein
VSGLLGRWGASAFVVVSLVGGTLLPVVPAAAVHGAVPDDFNGDGYRNAVLRTPCANVSGKEVAGAVVVLYGSASGHQPQDHHTGHPPGSRARR